MAEEQYGSDPIKQILIEYLLFDQIYYQVIKFLKCLIKAGYSTLFTDADSQIFQVDSVN